MNRKTQILFITSLVFVFVFEVSNSVFGEEAVSEVRASGIEWLKVLKNSDVSVRSVSESTNIQQGSVDIMKYMISNEAFESDLNCRAFINEILNGKIVKSGPLSGVDVSVVAICKTDGSDVALFLIELISETDIVQIWNLEAGDGFGFLDFSTNSKNIDTTYIRSPKAARFLRNASNPDD